MNVKLTLENIAYIRANHLRTIGQNRKFAEMFNVCEETISNIVSNRSWKKTYKGKGLNLQGEGLPGDYYLQKDRKSRTRKLDCEQVKKIRELIDSGLNNEQVAKLSPVGKDAVRKIRNKESYKECE